MNKIKQKEIINYLIFGVLTTLVYLISRMVIFHFHSDATLSASIANVIAIIFAFVTNDSIVFKQERPGWLLRFGKFIMARLLTLLVDIILAFLFVEAFPHIIGQFVNGNHAMINSIEAIISQGLIIVLNYILSKLFVFK